MEGIPMALLHASEGLLFLFSQWAILIIEFSGGLILVWGAFSGLKLLLHKQKNLPVKVRIALAEKLKLALEFYLAAEILKTVTLRNMDDIVITAVIVVLRIVMTILIHWEEKHDREELTGGLDT